MRVLLRRCDRPAGIAASLHRWCELPPLLRPGVPIKQGLPQFEAGLTQRLLRNYAVDLVSRLEGVDAADAVTVVTAR